MKKGSNKKGNFVQLSKEEKTKYNMKVVTSDVCERCRTQCTIGIAYMEKMRKPGAIGYGVPCHLTKGKAYK
ncbi:hypothetical protein [Halalkalibacterium halodurans]|uniref:BH2261 protein n=1 Tax=Halalkalibacterium halodurans (strain ATCC BAA-125 / DSM 18197 / FERM 7344 / JCM 9153 / C-125) TaxID=272558 RepID=Q9KAM6_HALH5|nr:hypothetical protein [Halalkalibacterium halodurans]MDY7222812.1 hypothetical protein [Halalkalibacterium halodurans]MDY7242033.1 hypothetical protein [Halalkalibacterium halodurans]MED4126106.1 hypothetical protein [Halalkalibacterium halodurans]MED4171294.1 hypothetical protein [Halalkalibacterium halodurans]BAB05980.1 BH2261 [Halalkalibacterium halodurans C-125]